MDSKALSLVALVAAAFAVLVGVWGLVSPGDMTSPGEIQESIRWAAAGILAAGVSALLTALARRR